MSSNLPSYEALGTPQWMTDVLGSQRLGGLDDSLVEAAARDADHVRVIASAIRPAQDREAANLRYLLHGLDVKQAREEYLTLARMMHRADPERHATTLVWMSERRPLEQCEAEVLRLAFDPRGRDVGRAWGIGRETAAGTLVQRLAFDVPTLPKSLPKGAPALGVAQGTHSECYQRAILLAYGVGERDSARAALERCLATRGLKPINDHDIANCKRIISRVMGGD